MTMPHLMNCEHSDSGWCLACVKELHDKAEALADACEILKSISTSMIRQFSERGARDVGVQAGADQWHSAWTEMGKALANYRQGVGGT